MSEVLEFDLLRQMTMQQVKIAQNTLALPIYLSVAPGDEPATGVWAEYVLLTGKTGRAELGGGKRGLQRTVGQMQFMLFCPEMTGDGDLWRQANRLKRLFDEITVQCGVAGYFTTEVFSIQTYRGARKGYTCLLVDGPIDFYSRNTDAPLTS